MDKKLIFLILTLFLSTSSFAASSGMALKPVLIDLGNKSSLQRGAQIYFNNCAGCHTLKYHRYSKFVNDLGISEKMIKDNLILTTTNGVKTKLGSVITNSINPDAIKEVFGKSAPVIGSTKSMTGHSLGATGAQEAIYSILMMQNDFIAPSINISTLVEEAEGLNISQLMMEQKLNAVMSNSFGFGGTNASLIFSKF